MTEIIGTWVRTLAVAAIVCGVALTLTPKSKVRSVLKVLCGVVLIIALISPFLDIDSADLSIDIAKYRMQAEQIAKDTQDDNTNMSRSIIEQDLEAYILDKAVSLGINDLAVHVGLKWGDEGFWYPDEIEITSNCSAVDKKSLSTYIEAQLGIPDVRQYWSVHEDG